MPKQAKTWILLRGTQYKPGGSLCLGQILVKPFEPSIPLLPDGPLPVPETQIERTHQISVDVGTSSALGRSFKLWAEVDMLLIQGEIGSNRDKSQGQQWHFDRIDSEIMVPRLADVEAAMQGDEVVAQINRSKFNFKQRLYMITGIRIVRGARLKQEASISKGLDATLGVDLTSLTGAPVTIGPGATITHTASENYAFEKSSDFVYAYRVCEIHYRKEIYVKPHTRGDTFSSGQNDLSEDEEKEEEEIARLTVEKFGDSDYAGSGVKHQTFEVQNSGQGRNMDGDGGGGRNESDDNTSNAKMMAELDGDGEEDAFIMAD